MLFDKIPAKVAIKWVEILEKKGNVEGRMAENIVAEIRGNPRAITGKIDENTIGDVKAVLKECNLKGYGVIKDKKIENEIKNELFEVWKKQVLLKT